MKQNASYWIKRLNLQPHPEGGFFKESYRSKEIIKAGHLPERFNQDYTFCTGIYFLLRSGDISALHRIKSDEIWHFYAGSTLTLYEIDREGMLFKIRLGPDLDVGELFQAHVRAGNWFGAQVKKPDSFALVGCTVAPGFEFDDFELGKRGELLQLFPRHSELIKKLTKA